MAAVQSMLVQDANDSINKIISDFDAGKVGLVQAADKVEAELRARFLLQDKVQMSSEVIGCDIENRGSTGCSALDVKFLVSDILEVGGLGQRPPMQLALRLVQTTRPWRTSTSSWSRVRSSPRFVQDPFDSEP